MFTKMGCFFAFSLNLYLLKYVLGLILLTLWIPGVYGL